MERSSVTAYAHAKINLSLNITGVNGNLHTLDTVMASVGLADVITVFPRSDNKVTVTYSDPRIAIGKDSVSKAVSFLKQSAVTFGADITVDKQIPLCGGLGGSGADAAGTIIGLNRIFGFGKEICENAAKKSGSDVLYLLRGGYARVTGTGDQAEFFDSPHVFHLVLARGEGGVQSGEAYRMFDEMYPGKSYCPADNVRLIQNLQNGCPFMANALTAPSVRLNPGIADTLTLLEQSGAKKALMSGSGAVCYGFFDSAPQAQTAAAELKKRGLWAKAACTVKSGMIVRSYNSKDNGMNV